jgi:hypothetical protein
MRPPPPSTAAEGGAKVGGRVCAGRRRSQLARPGPASNNISAALGEALRVNATLASLSLPRNDTGDARSAALPALRVNATLPQRRC